MVDVILGGYSLALIALGFWLGSKHQSPGALWRNLKAKFKK